MWIDVWQDEPERAAAHVLVKFARSRSARDQLILRAEYTYYLALARLGVESMYSLLSARPASRLRHRDVLARLRQVLTPVDWPALLLEYVRRDLLNLVFGNSDNHGRNMAVLRSPDRVELAPIYDFAPMKLDLSGIARSTHWGSFERGGEVDWKGLLASFGADEAFVRAGLRVLAEQLVGLPRLLTELGLPTEVLEFPALGLQRTEARLREWGLL